MRETESSQNSKVNRFKIRKQWHKKCRQARKLKNAHLLIYLKQSQYNTVSKQQKKQQQKIRNRQTAQINRDNKKYILQQLNNKIILYQKIINQLSTRQVLCAHCQRKVDQQSKEQEQVENWDFEDIRDQNDVQRFDYFERARNQESNHGFGLFFTIITISMCLMTGMYLPNQNTFVAIQGIEISSRLLQFVVLPSQQQFGNSQTKYQNKLQNIHQKVINTQIVRGKKSFIITTQRQVERPIFKQTSLALVQNKKAGICKVRQIQNLNQTCSVSNTTMNCLQHIHNCTISDQGSKKYKNLSSVKDEIIEHDVLFCELPRIYRYNKTQKRLLNGQFSLMLDGNALKEIFMDSKGFHLDNQSFSGFYEVKVNVENIQLVNRTTCNLSQY